MSPPLISQLLRNTSYRAYSRALCTGYMMRLPVAHLELYPPKYGDPADSQTPAAPSTLTRIPPRMHAAEEGFSDSYADVITAGAFALIPHPQLPYEENDAWTSSPQSALHLPAFCVKRRGVVCPVPQDTKDAACLRQSGASRCGVSSAATRGDARAPSISRRGATLVRRGSARHPSGASRCAISPG